MFNSGGSIFRLSAIRGITTSQPNRRATPPPNVHGEIRLQFQSVKASMLTACFIVRYELIYILVFIIQYMFCYLLNEKYKKVFSLKM